MTFDEILNQYMQELGCTAKRLSSLSNISMTQLSRYRNGVSVPYAESETITLLSKSLAQLASEKGIVAITEASVTSALSASAYSSEYDFDYDIFSQNVNTLITTLGIHTTRLSLYCNMDASTISRIRSGKQRPRDPLWIVQSIAQYTATHYFGISDQRKVMEIIGQPGTVFENNRAYSEAIRAWLSGSQQNYGNVMLSLLDNMDTFDINEFLRSRAFGKVKIPTVPFHIPSIKTYTGIKGMEEGILAFLKTTALSRPSRDVVIYSDHPLDHCMQESDFPGKWMRNFAAILLKGIHVHMIHNIDRPLQEMMLGLEAWVPVYMTGLITPYYFDNTRDNTHHHLLMVSGSAALTGDAVVGYHENGKYLFFKANAEVAHCRARADQLLSRAKPLMNIYRRDRKKDFRQMMEKEIYAGRRLKSFLTVPPIYTISDHLLARILARSHVSEKEASAIRHYAEEDRKQIRKFLQHGTILDDLALCTEAEFEDYPAALSLGGMFGQADLFYTYEEYLQHICETEKFAAEHRNYTLTLDRAPDFRNIQIVIREDHCVLISKNKAPTIHFVVHHPKMIDALSNLMIVLSEKERKDEKRLK